MLSRGGRERGKVYFADSYCSWQKGAIENANKHIRKYIPKKANFDDFSDSKIMKIQKKINRRPRKKINFDFQKDRFFKHFSDFALAVGLYMMLKVNISNDLFFCLNKISNFCGQ